MARRNPYRPGTPSYEHQRIAELNRRRALAEAMASRARAPELRKRAQQRAATARRGLQQIAARAEFRNQLSERERAEFNALSLKEQDRYRHGPSAERREFKSRLFKLFPNARNYPNVFLLIDKMSAAQIAELSSLSDTDLQFLVRRKDDFNEIIAEFIRAEPDVPYTRNPLWYRDTRTIIGVPG